MMLERHPLLFEKVPQRIKYLHALSYLVDKYAPKDITAKAVFSNYKTRFLPNAEVYEKNNGKDTLKNLKNILRFRLKHFKFYSYRFILLIDIAMIVSPVDRKKILEIAAEVKKNINRVGTKSIDEFLSVLLDKIELSSKYRLTDYHLNCWNKIQEFISLPEKKIMISSNMSSGKSTLINAIAGKRINRSMHEACTSKLHFINDKAFEDGYIYKYDYALDMNADLATLMENNPNNKSIYISVATYLRFAGTKKSRLSLIDSPGVNNSLDKTQEEIKRLIVLQNFDMFIYVINGEHIGTTDDFTYLQYLQPNLTGKQMFFVINKLDRFRLEEDSIEESVKKTGELLSSLGFESPVVCPISAYAGFLAKRKMYDNDFDESASREYDLLSEKLNHLEYDLSKYYNHEIQKTAEDCVKKTDAKHKKEITLLQKSGMLCFEILLYNGGSI